MTYLGYGCWLPQCGAVFVSVGKTLHLYMESRESGMNGYLIGQ